MSKFATLGLEFKDEYIPRQFQRSIQYLDDNKIDRKNWGLGKLYWLPYKHRRTVDISKDKSMIWLQRPIACTTLQVEKTDIQVHIVKGTVLVTAYFQP